MKKVIFAILMVFLIPNTSLAFEKRSGDYVNIASDEVIEGSLFVKANTIDIDGVVNGDVFCFSPQLEISGTVNGDIVCLGEDFYFSGTSTGDTRLLFQKARIDGNIGGNASVFAGDVEVTEKAKIKGELLLLAGNVNLAGEVLRDVYGAVRNFQLSSFVGGDLSLRQGGGFFFGDGQSDFLLKDGSSIGGDFNFKSEEDFTKENGAIIGGAVHKTITEKENKNYSGNIFWALVLIFANILVSFFLISLFRGFVLSQIDIFRTKISKSVWFGLLVFLIFPLAFILLLFTVIGIPLAMILLFVFIGTILISKSLISIFVGKEILGALKKEKEISLNQAAVIGAMAIFILTSLPYIGSYFSFFIMILVFGTTLQYFRTKLI